jgi:hypothetical protein
METPPVRTIAINEPYTVALVREEQLRSGETTAAKTAARLIVERIREIELERKQTPATAAAA